MQKLSLVAAGLAALGLAVAVPSSADTDTRVSGPHVHENLAVYFIHGASAPGPAPLTLQEALDKGSVRILETGEVNELRIENTGAEDIFIQSGDIVKGGRQDRVLTMSFVLPPNSGEVPLAAFCVERGRWSARGSESAGVFALTNEMMPSRRAKLAMRAPIPTAAIGPEQRAAGPSQPGSTPQDGVHVRQREVWAEVDRVQQDLSTGLTASIASPRSETSLQLSLESEVLKKARAGYAAALQDSGEAREDIVGYVLVINGRISSADIYPSNALFRKLWPKLLAAGVTEAIGAKADTAVDTPSAGDVSAFLASAEKGEAHEQVVGNLSHQEVRDADAAVFIEARSSDGTWVHRNYLAK